MIIWGTTGLKKKIGNGEFFCPQCSAPSVFDELDVRQFFTLYFIPLIPLGSAGKIIKCRGCSGTFAPEVKDYDPEVERANTTENVRQVCVLILNDLDRCKPAELLELCDVLGEMAEIEIEPEDVANDVLHAQEANVELFQHFKRNDFDFSEDGKWLVMVIIRKVLEAGSGIDMLVKERLYEIGKGLGLKKKHLTEFLENPLTED